MTKVIEIEKKSTKRAAFKFDLDTKYEVAVPEGFEWNKHKPLKKRNFKIEALYYDHRIAEMQFKIKQFAQLADDCRKRGSAADRQKARRIIKLEAKMAELRAHLTAQGINVAELLGTK